ncbi:hypothetical protein ACQP1V_09280 [Microtetraspora malaysiensis]|uniref:hypothetical protein n=1 Tax=Microtetraspora malaysiensis TaxID=161358 RepID=UPI003D8C8DB3
MAERDKAGNAVKLWDSWLVGKPLFGKDVRSMLTVAVVGDLNRNGVLDDAPDTVKDLNGDGRVDAKDLRKLGVTSNITEVPFHITGSAA